MGRPRIYNTDEELQSSVDEYFIYIQGERKEVEGKEEVTRYAEPPTITGLALFLGFDSRQSFYDYENNTEFSYTIKRARLRIESEYEKSLSRNSPTGAIFALKNMGWKDKTEVEQSGNLNLNWNEVKNYGINDKANHSS